MGVYISDANGKLKKYAGGSFLYGTAGQNTDGGMTQKAITDELDKKSNIEVVDVLWNNSNVTSAQSAQTITISKDLKQYKAFILLFNRQTDNQTTYTVTNYKEHDSAWIYTNLVGVWGYNTYQRFITMRMPENAVNIGDCYKQTSFGGGAVDNTKNILIGIRGVR